jgi:hypothetical protein
MRLPRKLRPDWKLILAPAVLALLFSCRTHDPGEFHIECTVRPQPPHVGSADVEIMLTDSHRALVGGAQVSLEADMSHPGMAPIFQEASATEDGKYHSRLKFDMPGDWTLLVKARLASGVTVDRQMRLTVEK